MNLIVHAFLKFCMVLNPTLCQELEIAPIDASLSLPLCMRGLMMGNQEPFLMNGASWQIRGGSCKLVPNTLVDTTNRLKASVTP